MPAICLAVPNTLTFPQGGYLWIFLNWALGFQSLGFDVHWLDIADAEDSPEQLRIQVETLCHRLRPYGLDASVSLCTRDGNAHPLAAQLPLVPLEQALAAEFLCDHRYDLPARIVSRFRRSMLLDIDPGLLHESLTQGYYTIAPHSAYFTIGEFVRQPKATWKFDAHGYDWQYCPPLVSVEHWPVASARKDAAFNTVSNWNTNHYMPDGQGGWYHNDKRAAFEPYMSLPATCPAPLELCLELGGDEAERRSILSKGWRVVDGATLAEASAYHSYVQQSLGEFSCAKPGYVKLQTGWLSDRTVCYLASGKPVIIQKTGASDLLPDDAGMFRFTNPAEARQAIETVCADYPRHSHAARKLAEDLFDAPKVLKGILSRII